MSSQVLADDNIHIRLPGLHRHQRFVKQTARRFNVVKCGRRWGKTTLGVDVLINSVIDGYPGAWFSPSYKMLKEVWLSLVQLLAPVVSRANETDHRIDLVTGGVIDMWSLDSPQSPRGRKYKVVVIDESALVADMKDIWYSVIRPTLADYQGKAWFMSTPRGYNFFRTIWNYGQDKADSPDWMSWHYTTYDNPYIAKEEVDSLKDELPERTFGQEIMAQFLDTLGGVFRRVRECATAQMQPAAWPGQRFVGGIDWGRTTDSTWLTIMDLKTHSVVAMDYFTAIGYETQITRLKAMHERFKPTAWLAEANSMGGPLIERLNADGMPVQPFTTTAVTKAKLIDNLVLGFERGDLSIPMHEILLEQLDAYEVTMLPSGMPKYSAPNGEHDDGVISLALVYLAAKREPIQAPPASLTASSKWDIYRGVNTDDDDTPRGWS